MTRYDGIIVRPLELWPWPETTDRRRAQFKSPGRYQNTSATPGDMRYVAPTRIPLDRTLKELRKELDAIGADGTAVLELDVPESRIRNDGWLYGQTTPASPRVALTFEHPAAGSTRMPCDTFDDWRDNVRAIRLALEALRAVDRYGVTRHAEQYRGWTALPAESSAGRNVRAAALLVVRYNPETEKDSPAMQEEAATALLADQDTAKRVLRAALRQTHPDSPEGSTEDFQAVEQARQALAVHFNTRL